MKLGREQGRIRALYTTQERRALKDNGINTEEIIWKQQAEKTCFVSAVKFELELCRRVNASLDQLLLIKLL